jgi:septal ring factor EnvC (AmiA/AmiB activator)
MPSMFDRFVGAMWPEFQALTERVRELQRTLTEACDRILDLEIEQEKLMATQAQFDERMTKVDAATTEVANDLQKLRDELKAGGAISDANLALLDAKIARLVVIGADPENPAPTPEV